MNGELLSILENIEREKGIKKDILIEAVEAALASAAKKVVGSKTDPIAVKLDRESGEITIFQGETKINSEEFGRIAAQTAKQVIIQKIREAEREVIYNDFINKVNQIVSGTVHRFEKGNIIVDLGKTEGLLPKREQVQKEKYKQGERIRVYLLEVEKTTKGPNIILSRSHPVLVKRLFELEVPEISEGIVEIKSISREAGDRTKIAVYSKDEKIDCVGACVGMRGSRVKNIVREMHGEKIDIVRWNEDPAEYIKSALNPAKVVDIKLDKEKKQAVVKVEDQYLSLAIGKHGQNVRLAVKLTGWNIDLKSEEKPAVAEIPIIELPQIGLKLKQALAEAKFVNMESIANAKIEDLTKIKGIGKKRAQTIIDAAKEALKPAKKEKKEEKRSPEQVEGKEEKRSPEQVEGKEDADKST